MGTGVPTQGQSLPPFQGGSKDNIRLARSCCGLLRSTRWSNSRAPAGSPPSMAKPARSTSARSSRGSACRAAESAWIARSRARPAAAAAALAYSAQGSPGAARSACSAWAAAGSSVPRALPRARARAGPRERSDRPRSPAARRRLPAAKGALPPGSLRPAVAAGRARPGPCARSPARAARRRAPPRPRRRRGDAHRLGEQLRRLLEALLVVQEQLLPPLPQVLLHLARQPAPVQDDAGSDGESNHRHEHPRLHQGSPPELEPRGRGPAGGRHRIRSDRGDLDQRESRIG